MMRLRRSGEGSWFYGCSQWPDCHYTFDADQTSGAPIAHTRHGIPFRRALTKGMTALFEALGRDSFNLEAAQELEGARRRGKASRGKSIRDMDRAKVLARIQEANPRTLEEWLEFVLTERLYAIQDDLDDTERRRKMLEGPMVKVRARKLRYR